jgi:hypothetical protein
MFVVPGGSFVLKLSTFLHYWKGQGYMLQNESSSKREPVGIQNCYF